MSPKKILRLILINLGSLLVAARLVPGMSIGGGVKTALYAALGLTLINFLIKPLIKLLLLPVNLMTLGAFRWLINVIALYLLVLLVSQLTVNPFTFPGFTYQGFIIPQAYISTFWAYVICSLVISFSTTFILWLIK